MLCKFSSSLFFVFVTVDKYTLSGLRLVTLVAIGLNFFKKVDIFDGIVIRMDLTLLTDRLKFSVNIEMTPPIQVRPIRIQKNTDIRYILQ